MASEAATRNVLEEALAPARPMRCARIFFLFLAALTLLASASFGQTPTPSPACPPVLSEGFETVPALFSGGGWAQQNLSNPPGAGIWTQGSPTSGLGAAQAGTTNSFMVVNSTSGTGVSNLSNWAFMPTMTLRNGDVLSFYTRTPMGSSFPDRLQVRMSTNGASVNVGADDTTVGDFTNLLLDINPTLAVGGYPDTAWTQFNVTISGLGGPTTSGRIAFRYFVTSGGPSGANSNIIGIDTLTYTSTVCPTPTPTATPTPATATPTASPSPCGGIVFTENFDGVAAPALPAGWVSTLASGNPPLWTTSTTSPDTAPNDAFVVDPNGTSSDKTLDSPGIAIPTTTAQLSFRNNFDLQNTFDGGVLEVSSPNIAGGAFTDITNAAVGGSFVTGVYTATINAPTNPLTGRMAWSGNSGGYIDTVVNLGANVSGQTIKLRFRIGTDSSVAAPGWRIDTIRITVAGPCPSPTPSPSPTVTPATPTPTITPSIPTPTPTVTPATPTPSPTASPTPTVTPPPTPTASPTPSPAPATQAVNLSTRMRVETGDRVAIGGFIIAGNSPKHVLLRAIGPSLTHFGIVDVLADPVLELHGPGGFTTIVNNNWRDTQEAEILATNLAPTDNFESAIAGTLAPGAYTTIVRGNGNTSGIALVEIYDLGQGVASKLVNLSTRAFVGTGENIVIAGFMLGNNNGDDRIVVRGLGPSLTAFGVPNVLANPGLELRNSNGALLASNDDWQDICSQATEITAAGLAPSNNLEAAIAATLPPGLYTVLFLGQNNGTGIGLVELYDRGTGNGAPSPTPSCPPSPTPTATPPPGSCTENFDGVTAPALPTGWVATNAPGPDPLWITSLTTPDTAPNDAVIKDPPEISDKRLETRNIAITSASAQLSVRNNFNLQNTFDGGVLEVSSPNIAGGAFTDVTNSAVGGSFVTGGYTNTINAGLGNPIAGRMAWSGNSGGYINTVANLGPHVIGQTIKLRFRLGTDQALAVGGWRIDTISITGASCP